MCALRLERLLPILIAVAGAPAPPARAQSFPADAAWVPLVCRNGLMTDPVRDQSGATRERDIVGSPDAPAGFRAVDGQFLYLRMRLDSSPAQGASLRPFAWGFAFSTDGVSSSYEILISVDGAARVVALYKNTTTTVPDSPADPADTPPVATYPFASHGRTGAAAGAGQGGDPDAFLDMAVPWADLSPLGLRPDSSVQVWAASSTGPDRLNGDVACHDGGGAAGVPSLSQVAPSGLAPAAGGTGGAGGGAGPVPGGTGLEGGPGCDCNLGGGRPAPGPSMLLVLGSGVWLLSRRRRRAA